MNNTIPKSPEEIAERFLELKNKIVTITEKYPENDGRFIILNNCNLAIISIITRLNTWTALSNNSSLHDTFSQIIGLDIPNLAGFLRHDIFFVRLSFIVMFQFQIETLFKNILKKLDGKQPPEKYGEIVKRLLKVLGLDSKEKENTFNVLAYIRNCFHSNGIHTKKSVTVIIDGEKFEFLEGRAFSRGDYGDVYFISSRVIEIIDEILNSDKVKNISHMPYQYDPNLTSSENFGSFN